jgi:hypothetical protein
VIRAAFAKGHSSRLFGEGRFVQNYGFGTMKSARQPGFESGTTV